MMEDYYGQYVTSMSASGLGGRPAIAPEDTDYSPTSVSSTPAAYRSFSYLAGCSELGGSNSPGLLGKSRRKSASGVSGTESIKHRRTRSGCFTCRARRVKCDEHRPTCHRCRKGNRDCVYPEASSSSSKSGQSGKAKNVDGTIRCTTTPTSSNEDDEEHESDSKLTTIPDNGEAPEMGESTGNPDIIQTSYSSINVSLETSRDISSPELSTAASAPKPWCNLPADFQHHLDFYSSNISNYHYNLTIDSDDFFKISLPKLAVQSETLLNAVVAFAAYHAAVRDPDGTLQDFLGYYNRSVTLLLQTLKGNESYSVTTLLTILQLATIEETLGDLVNLLGHQKAAMEILMKVFSPSSVMVTPLGRLCLSWYTRFDNIVALLGGFPTAIPRAWFLAMTEFCAAKVSAEPEDLRWRIEDRSARIRLISYDMSILYARGNTGEMSNDDFMLEHDEISRSLVNWKESWHPMLTDKKYNVSNFPWRSQLYESDIVDPYVSNVLYEKPLLSSTIVTAEWHSIVMMHRSQSLHLTSDTLFEGLNDHAYTTCQIFETLERWPSVPAGVLAMLQPCVAIAALFLPQDERHHWWLRRKFALLESLGSIHPANRRAKMATLFRDDTCVRWWLPNDEGFIPVLQRIRTFADERNTGNLSPQQESLREIKQLYAKLELS